MWGNGTEIDAGKWNRDTCGEMKQRYMWGNGTDINERKWNKDTCGQMEQR